jgi:hypothetical protein
MIRNGRVDVNRVYVRIFEQFAVIGIAGLDAVTVAALVQALPVTAADRVEFGAGLILIDGNELGPES